MKKTILLITTIVIIGCQNQQPDNDFVTEKWSNGKPKVIELKTQRDNSISYQLEFDSIGRLKEFKPLTDNRIDGSQIYFRDNAELGAVLNHVDGKREGYTYEFYPGAQIAFQGIASDDQFHGPTEWYHKNGQVEATGQRLNDQYDGEWIEYHENGQIRAKGTYTNGKKNDDWTYWTETGEIKEKNTAGNKK